MPLWKALLIVFGCAGLGGAVWWSSPAETVGGDSRSITETEPVSNSLSEAGSDRSAGKTEADPDRKQNSPSPAELEQLRRREILIGTWTQNYNGKRTFEVREDGTLTLTLIPPFLARFRYGSKLTMEMDWSLEGDTLTLMARSGTPGDKYQNAIQDFGAERVRTIRTLEPRTVVLVDPSDGVEEPPLERGR